MKICMLTWFAIWLCFLFVVVVVVVVVVVAVGINCNIKSSQVKSSHSNRQEAEKTLLGNYD